MNVFIVRPFAVKSFVHRDGKVVSIDFDQVQRTLIDPALRAAGLAGGTTAEIARAGNIRADMFQLLLTAEIVIADISIHNANVYYELGVRHALRDKRTILIRARADEVPFDLRTDRYMEYDAEDPGAAVATLEAVLQATIASQGADSPIYQMLPDLPPPNPAVYQAVPPEFRTVLECARRERDLPLLGVLAHEARPHAWYRTALRLIGAAQFDLGAHGAARHSWEQLRRYDRDEPEANLVLGTIYQRLDDLARSNQALECALENSGLNERQRSEARALQARNLKAAWIASWRAEPQERQRRVALRSGLLQEALDAYQRAFEEDLDHYYPGLNALALATVQLELAAQLPAVWEARFEERDDAERALRSCRRRRREIEGALRLAMRAARRRIADDERVWLDLSLADLRLLTSDRAEYVRAGYADARDRLSERRSANGPPPAFAARSASRQLRFLLQLGVLEDNARAALEELGVSEEDDQQKEEQARTRIVVATGHRVDAPGRTPPRFPRTSAAEKAARGALRAALLNERNACTGALQCLTGAASGTDILFAELCDELEIPVQIVLPIPYNAYLRRSVADSGGEWVERFRSLCAAHAPVVLSDAEALPGWIHSPHEYSVFARGNLWMLEYAFSRPRADVTLIALWNGAPGDGPGGTSDMIEQARKHGAKVVHLDSRELFGCSESQVEE